ncbi:MAG: cobalamin-dependent protein [Candidatus Pelethousia sp.]|nr:cobalamin-dependent protein [Candidatus Pelethousia sp.]
MNELLKKLTDSVIDTDEGNAAELAQEALAQGVDVFAIVDALTAGINELGRQFENLECFLPELILGGNAMESAMAILTPEIEKRVEKTETPISLVVGNLQGDIHDIGREILCTMLRVAGFTVHNLGNNVKANVFVEKALEHKADFIGLSSLLTTSLPFSKEVLSTLEACGVRDKIKVIMGGGAVTREYVEQIGADGYSGTAVEAVELVKKMYAEGK